jgi:hypothetical protein
MQGDCSVLCRVPGQLNFVSEIPRRTGDSIELRGILRLLSMTWARDYSYRNASIGLSLAALIAGNIPLIIPTKLRIAVDQIRVAESM